MGYGALKVKAVTSAQAVFFIPQANLQLALEHEQEFLAYVRVGFAASRARSDTEQMRLHDRVAPCEQLHSNPIAGLEYFPARRTHHEGLGLGGIIKIENIVAVIAGKLAQRAHRCGHLRALERTEEPDGNSDRLGDTGERLAPLQPQLPQARADGDALSIAGKIDSTFALERLHNGWRIHPANFAEETSAFQQLHVFAGIQTVSALGSSGSHQT